MSKITCLDLGALGWVKPDDARSLGNFIALFGEGSHAESAFRNAMGNVSGRGSLMSFYFGHDKAAYIQLDNQLPLVQGLPPKAERLISERLAEGKVPTTTAFGGASNFFLFYEPEQIIDYAGPKAFRATISQGASQRGEAPRLVAFGPGGSYLVIWNDGTTDYHLLPLTLVKALAAMGREEVKGVRSVQLGSSAESWVMMCGDGGARGNVLPDSLMNTLNAIRNGEGRVRFVGFGPTEEEWSVRFFTEARPPLAVS